MPWSFRWRRWPRRRSAPSPPRGEPGRPSRWRRCAMSDAAAASTARNATRPQRAPREHGDTAGAPILVAEGITKSYRMGRARLTVLRDCGVRVHPGEFVAIMGKSGSGKSTLLHILGALDVADQGEVWFDGRPLFGVASAV